MKAGEQDITFSNLGIVGKGSFGVVFKTQLVEPELPERVVALKKVLQDRRYKV